MMMPSCCAGNVFFCVIAKDEQHVTGVAAIYWLKGKT